MFIQTCSSSSKVSIQLIAASFSLSMFNRMGSSGDRGVRTGEKSSFS